jgi:uncharacterized membrane protein HdeD (DUF308 family)
VTERFVLQAVTRNWWVLVVRGLLAVGFGLAAFAWPGATLAILVLLWGAYAVADGIAAVVNGVRMRWWSVVLFGAFGVLAGIYALARPMVAATALLLFVGVWAILRGILEIVAAISLREEITGEWLFMLGGVASVAFGALVIAYPGAGAMSLVWILGTYALVIGVLLVGVGLRVRSVARFVEGRLAA